MKVTVFGAGAVGGYFGGRLAGVGEDVAFVARGQVLHAVREHGLRVTSTEGDFGPDTFVVPLQNGVEARPSSPPPLAPSGHMLGVSPATLTSQWSPTWARLQRERTQPPT